MLNQLGHNYAIKCVELIIIADESKLVNGLGERSPLPVEVIPFARPVVARAIKKLGGDPMLRKNEAEEIYHTDNKNEILDCKFADGIADARQMELDLDAIPGVVESGLFIDLCQIVVGRVFVDGLPGIVDGVFESRVQPFPDHLLGAGERSR